MLYGSDTLALGYMVREFYANAVSGGSFPLWNPIILGGTPFVESLAGGDSLYPPSALLLFLMDPYRALGWKLVLHVFLAGIFMYGWIRCLGLSKPSALLAGLAYGLAPFMVSLVLGGQDGKIFLVALTPLLFWVTESFSRSRWHEVDRPRVAGGWCDHAHDALPDGVLPVRRCGGLRALSNRSDVACGRRRR